MPKGSWDHELVKWPYSERCEKKLFMEIDGVKIKNERKVSCLSPGGYFHTWKTNSGRHCQEVGRVEVLCRQHAEEFAKKHGLEIPV